MSEQKAVSASALVDSWGVNTHLNYTDGGYADVHAVVDDLRYLGLTNLRDAAPNPAFQGQNALGIVASEGFKFDFITCGNVDPSLAVQRLQDFAAQHAGAINAVEGPNEVNNWPVSTGGLTAEQYQDALYTAVKSNPLLASINVLSYTDASTPHGMADTLNVHTYAVNGEQAAEVIAGGLNAIGGGWITETGYQTGSGGWAAPVDEITQAKRTLNLLADAAAQGVGRTYLYQLLDAYADPAGTNSDDHFGLFRLDGSAKPAATAIHNLTTLLQDNGTGGAAVGSLDYQFDGLPETGHSFLTEKSDGSFQILVWNEGANSAPVHVSFGESFESIDVYDPLTGTSAIQSIHNASGLTIAVPDHPLVIQVSGASVGDHAAPTSAVSPSAAETIALAASDASTTFESLPQSSASIQPPSVQVQTPVTPAFVSVAQDQTHVPAQSQPAPQVAAAHQVSIEATGSAAPSPAGSNPLPSPQLTSSLPELDAKSYPHVAGSTDLQSGHEAKHGWEQAIQHFFHELFHL